MMLFENFFISSTQQVSKWASEQGNIRTENAKLGSNLYKALQVVHNYPSQRHQFEMACVATSLIISAVCLKSNDKRWKKRRRTALFYILGFLPRFEMISRMNERNLKTSHTFDFVLDQWHHSVGDPLVAYHLNPRSCNDWKVNNYDRQNNN